MYKFTQLCRLFSILAMFAVQKDILVFMVYEVEYISVSPFGLFCFVLFCRQNSKNSQIVSVF